MTVTHELLAELVQAHEAMNRFYVLRDELLSKVKLAESFRSGDYNITVAPGGSIFGGVTPRLIIARAQDLTPQPAATAKCCSTSTPSTERGFIWNSSPQR